MSEQTLNAPAAADDARAAPLWSGIVALSLSVFGLVTAEFLPPSVLTPMAADLGVSLGSAGQAVTATAVVGAFAALLVPVATRRWDRRAVMLGLLALLCVSNLVTATAANLAMLLAARLLLGISLGGFWSMAAAVAMRLVPMERLPKAMSIVFTGVTLATVSAAPLGAYVGDLWGWRAAFLLAGAVGVAALLAVWLTLPKLRPTGAADLAGLVEVARRPPVAAALAGVLLMVSGHFAGFTYIRPVLEEVTRLGVGAISVVLLVFGAAGFVGNIVGGLLAQRDPRLAVSAGAAAMALAMGAVMAFGASPWVTGVSLGLWGMAFATLPVGFQAWVAQASADKAELGGGLLTATFQVAIASGAVFGGLLVDRLGVLGASAYCAAAATGGLLLVGRQLGVARRRAPAPAPCEACGA